MARKKSPRAKPASLKTPPPPKVTKAEILAAKSKDAEENKTSDTQAENSSVVCLSHIPHGFFEGQMKKYFSQFGQVKKLRLSRSKKSGRSRGFAFIEFEFPEVAKVVAETMNGYLTYQKIMKCRVLPTEKIHPQLFKGCEDKFKKPWHREASRKRHNSLLTAGEERIHTAQKRRVQLEKRRNKKLEKLGIEFKSDTLEAEWENLKGTVKGTKSKKKGNKKNTTPQKTKKRKTQDDESSPTPKKVKASEDEESADEMESSEEELLGDIADEFDSSSDNSSLDQELEDLKPRTGQKKSVQSAEKAKEFISLKKEKGPSQDRLGLSAKKTTPLKEKESVQRKSKRFAKKAKAATPFKKEKEHLQEKSTPSSKKAKLTTPKKIQEASPDAPAKKSKSTPFKKGKEIAEEKASLSTKKAKLPAPTKEKELSLPTSKSEKKATKGKTPMTAKNGSKVTQKGLEPKSAPLKTPKKVMESGTKASKTPKSVKAKTPKSGARKAKVK